MFRISNLLWMFALLVGWALPGLAQQPATGAASQIVPPLVNFSGALTNTNGKATTGVVGLTFSLYKDSEGGAPLWVETQNVRPDKTGHYSVRLGEASGSGLPRELFASGEARWLGVQQPGQAEQPRVLLMSVPYALKALDAETIGGKPASAFMMAPASASGAPASSSSIGVLPPLTGTGTPNHITKWITATKIGNSGVFETAAGNVGIGTIVPAVKFDVNGLTDIRKTLTLFPSGVTNTLAISGTAFKIDNTGKVTFIAGQTFPGTGTVTSVGSGAGLTGGPITTSGTLSVANAGVTNAMLQNSSLTVTANSPLNGGGVVSLGGSTSLGLANCAANQILEFTGGAWACVPLPVGTVNNVASGTDIIVSNPTGPTATVNLDTTKVPQLAAANAFTNNNGISVNSSGYGLVVSNAGAGNGIDIAVTASGAEGLVATGGVEGVVSDSTTFPIVGFGSEEGVFGENLTDGNFQPGIYGYQGGSTTVTIGVEGYSASPIGVGNYGVAIGSSFEGSTIDGSAAVGVWGDTSGDWGVLGSTDEGDGIVGFNSSEPFATGYFENDETASATAPVLVTVGGSIGGACMFDVSGDMYCSGSKSAVVPVDNGARKVALYAVESPKNWFEDFGSGRLSNGSAVIELEPTFAQTVNTQSYHVFLTPSGDCKGLYVSQRSAGGFEVRELGGGTSSVDFDYRIVAERRGYENIRMADKTELFQAGAMLKGGKKRATPLRAPVRERPPRPARSAMVRSALEPINMGRKAR
jgi:hypothetical protein